MAHKNFKLKTTNIFPFCTFLQNIKPFRISILIFNTILNLMES